MVIVIWIESLVGIKAFTNHSSIIYVFARILSVVFEVAQNKPMGQRPSLGYYSMIPMLLESHS
ncbi:MAG: hypothetical protein C7B43_19215 [Sulfobacillus benefaciens]|uniref:Uncharacterized protein n=1 Tax=Sulfobacillus benefaciens TaxID=453960 RepID=A0A2T2WQ51_9FIRM|nr:MAG: hypothetical protein C7B43_19215 [Sulfobacillus benefaciens]